MTNDDHRQSLAQACTLFLPTADWEEFAAALDVPNDESWLRLRALKPVWEDRTDKSPDANV